MSVSKQLLIVAHQPSDNTLRLAQTVLSAARHPDISGVETRLLTPFATQPDDVLGAAGIILGTTENFGYMSGALKDFFDRIYTPCLDATRGLPYGVFIRAGNDGRGALASIERIVTGLAWRRVFDPVIAVGEIDAAKISECEELGMTLAAGLEAGIF